MYYYYILLAYYIFGIVFFLGSDFIYSRKNKNLKAVKFDKTYAYYRVLKESRSQNKLVSIFYLWKYNKEFNKLSFVKNLFSIVFVSFNSLKKYGFKKGV